MQLTKTITFAVEVGELGFLLPYKNGHWIYLANLDELWENIVFEFLEMNEGWYCGRSGGGVSGDWAICSGLTTNNEDAYLGRLREELHTKLVERLECAWKPERRTPEQDPYKWEDMKACLNGIQEYCSEFNPFNNNEVILQWEDDDQELVSY